VSEAEGGTISGRRPMISQPEHCDECGFDARSQGGPDIADAVRSIGESFRVPLTSGDPGVRRRPDEKTWSPLEYGAHMRDVVAIWSWGLKQALTSDRPQFPAPDADIADRTAEESSYGDLNPAVVADELVANTERAAAKFAAVKADGWSRVIVLGDEDITVLSIANKILHEGRHHLNDVERML
jgi:DinB family protein